MSYIEVKKNKNESFDAMFRRFSKRFQRSGKLLQVRGGERFTKKLSKNAMKRSALRSKKIGQKRAYLLRAGLLKEEDRRGRRR